MKDQSKTKQVLIQELASLKQRIAELEQAEPEHKRTEQELLLKNLIFDASITANSVADIKGKLTHANSSFIRMWGYRNKEEVIGKPISDFLKFEHEARKIITALNANNEWTGEYTALRRDGTIFNAYAQATIVADEFGNTMGYQSTVLDITDRKKAAESNRRESLFRKSIIDNAADGICVCHEVSEFPYTHFTVWNQHMTNITGYTREEINFQGWYQTVYPDPEIQAKASARMDRMRQGDNLHHDEWEITRKDGQRRQLLISTCIVPGGEAGVNIMAVMNDITDRKRAENALRDSESKYQFLAESMADVVFMLDMNLVTTYVSPSIERMLGFTPEERIAQKVDQQLTLKSQKLAFEALVAELDREKEKGADPDRSQTLELEYYHKDGSIRHLVTYIRGMRDGEGNLTGFYGSHHDITDRKQVEEALRDSKEQYRTLVENASDIVFRTDGTGHFTFINQAALRLTGYEEEEIIGRHYPTLIHPDMRDEAIKFFGRQFVKRIQNTYLEYPLLTKEGHKLWCGQNTQLIFEDDHVVGFQAVSRDITERKQAEEELKRSEERYRTILDEIEDGYQEVDLSGNFTFFNESFRKIFGYSEKELVGSNFRRYAADEEIADRVYQAYNQMYKTGNPLKRFEWDIITQDGTRRSIEFSASLLRDREGHRRGFRGIVRDVTERKSAEEQYRTMANSAQTGVYIVQDGRLCFVNPYIPSYSGYPEEELIGKRVLHFVHPDDRKMVREMARKMLTGELTAPYEYRIEGKDNQVRWIMETVTPISYKGRSAVLGNTMDTTDRKRTEEELRQTLESLRKAFGATIQVMVAAVESRDPYTAGHQIRSADLARSIATEMGLPQEKIDGIRMAGSIHDIGKLSIPAEILSKPTKLSEIEFSLIKEHARIGYEILKDVESPWPLADIVYQHHERMDGSGYPGHLKGEELLMEARIMAVADVVESMASHRPYRPALGLNAAMEEIENNKGTLYDAGVADACLRLFREKGFQLEKI